ncbi:hypothetical protein C8R45DRAFT_1222723, partial [Mycena sanguinolenta]
MRYFTVCPSLLGPYFFPFPPLFSLFTRRRVLHPALTFPQWSSTPPAHTSPPLRAPRTRACPSTSLVRRAVSFRSLSLSTFSSLASLGLRSRDSVRGKRTASAGEALAAPLSPTPLRCRHCATCRGVAWGCSASSTTPLSLSPFTSLAPYSIMTFAPTRIIPKTETRIGIRTRGTEAATVVGGGPGAAAAAPAHPLHLPGNDRGKQCKVSGTGVVSSRGRGGSGSARTSVACVPEPWRGRVRTGLADGRCDVDVEDVDSRRKMRESAQYDGEEEGTAARGGDTTTMSNLNHGVLFLLLSICHLY